MPSITGKENRLINLLPIGVDRLDVVNKEKLENIRTVRLVQRGKIFYEIQNV